MAHADDFVPDHLTSDGGFGRDWVPLGDVPDDPLFSRGISGRSRSEILPDAHESNPQNPRLAVVARLQPKVANCARAPTS